MNTGIQRSGTTPAGTNTTTTPVGKISAGNLRWKKNLVDIALAHKCVYVATASVHLPIDLQNKVKKALKMKGPKFIHILAICPLGWGSEPAETIKVAEVAVRTGFWPLVEYENGVLTKVRKIKKDELLPIEEYFKLQKRFAHLLKEENKHIVEMWKEKVKENIEKYSLLED
jgi:pyruvate ferredoxin oxidoreductase beta subunit